MALIQVNLYSNVLKRIVPVQVILPTDKSNGIRYVNNPDMKYKTLYLLHGLLGNYMSWISATNIQAYAEAHNLAVVMPSGENSFYVEQPLVNSDYGRYIGEELVDAMCRIFPFSEKREDTFIGGLSMGGFGALRNGLKYAETFGYVIALSSAIHIFELKPSDPRRGILCREDECMGKWEEAVLTDKNPAVALRELQERVNADKAAYPKVYMACGTEDGLLGVNRSFLDKLEDAGVEVVYKEETGGHEWSFWDRHIRNAIENWLPLSDAVAGTNDGNVIINKNGEMLLESKT